MKPDSRLLGATMLLITACSWGVNWPVLKFVLAVIPPFTFRVITGVGGVVLLFAIALWRGDRIWPPRGQWRRLVVASLLNITSFTGLATLALIWLTATEAVIIAYTMPVWAAMLAWPILGERPTWPRVAGLVLGLSGVAVLLAGSLLAGPTLDVAEKWPGILFILGTALFFALGTVVTKRWPVVMAPVPLVGWQIGIGSIPLLLGAIVLEHRLPTQVPPLVWAAVAYVIVIGLAVSYLAWFRALKLLAASTAAIGTLLVPVIGVLSSTLLLGEPLGLRQGLALTLTVGGVALASRG